MRYFQAERNLANEEDQLAYISDVMQKLAGVESPVEQDLYLNQIANRFSLEKDSLKLQLLEFINKTKSKHQVNSARKENLYYLSRSSTDNFPKYSKAERAERLLVYRLLHDPNIRIRMKNYPDFSFIHEEYQMIYILSEGYFNAYPEYETARFLDFIDKEKIRQIVVSLELQNLSKESSDEEFEDCINVIGKQSPLEQQINNLKQQITDAKKLNNIERVTFLTIELIKLLQQQQNDKSASL